MSSKNALNSISVASTTHPLVFSSTYQTSTNGYQFLELPDELVDEFESGLSGLSPSSSSSPKTTLVFKGNKDDPLTFHTKNTTYKVRQVQTSNTYFILQTNSQQLDDIEETNHVTWSIPYTTSHYLEVIKHSPNMAQVQTLLNSIPPFSGHFEDILPEASTFSFSQLLNEIQASEQELKKELERIHAIEIQGVLRVLDPHYLKDALTLVISIIVAQDWDVKNVSSQSLSTSLSEFDIPKSVSDHILLTFSESLRFSGNGDFHVELSNSKISNYIAKVLLLPYSLGERIPYEAFFIKWKEAVPEPLHCDPSYLHDCGYFEMDSVTSSQMLVCLSRDRLPCTLPDRLRVLFQLQAQWRKASLIYWIQDLIADQCPKRAEQWLLRHAKLVKQENNEVMFLARKDLLTLR